MNWIKVGSIRPNTNNYTIDNLVHNTQYQFRVFAENSIGLSLPLETETAILAKPPYSKNCMSKFFHDLYHQFISGAPSIPEGPILISDIVTTGCTINWSPSIDSGGSKILSYVIEAREAKRFTWYQVDTVDPTETKYKIKDLVENNAYFFRVAAKNSIGLSEYLETTTPIEIKRSQGVPDTPIPLLVSDIQSHSAMLEWKPPVWSGGNELKGYTIEMKIGDDGSWSKVTDVEPSLRRYQINDLREGTEYYFRLSAYNDIGSSKPLELNRPVIPKRQLTKPSNPSGPITSLKTNRDSITITWGPPKDDGGAPINRYIIYYREANHPNWIRGGAVRADTFSFHIHNLTENSDYHFRVLAENAIGTGEHLTTQEPIKAKSPYNVPDIPQGPLRISDITDSCATVQWQKPLIDGGSPITAYLIKRRDVERPVWVKCGRVNADTFLYTIKDLVEGCEYAVQVFAENSEGLSAPLVSSENIIPIKRVKVPGSPLNFECIYISSEEITLQWEAPLTDGGSPIQFYEIEKSELKKGKALNWTVVSREIDHINTSFIVKNLHEGHSYSFRITAINSAGGSEPTNIDKVIRTKKFAEAPPTPNGPLRILNVDDESITISWEKSNSNLIDGYVIEVREAIKANWITVGKTSYINTEFKITNLTHNDKYYVRIRAENESNLISQALELDEPIIVKSSYTVPSEPLELKCSKIENNTVTLEFKRSDSDGGYPIKWYVVEKRDVNRLTWIKTAKVKSNDAIVLVEIDDLHPGTTYLMRVMAENNVGQSKPAELKEPITIEKRKELPPKPMDLKVRRLKQANRISLEWRSSAWKESDISQYIIEVWNSKINEWSKLAEVDGRTTTFEIDHLEDDVQYKFRILSMNATGLSEPSLSTMEVTKLKKCDVPEPPKGPLTYKISDKGDSIKLEWQAPNKDGGSKIKGYVIEKQDNVLQLLTSSKYSLPAKPSDWTRAGYSKSASIELPEYFVSEARYNFRVRAENDIGKSQPLELKETIIYKPKVKTNNIVPTTEIRIIEKTSNSVNLNWTANVASEKYIIEKQEIGQEEWIKSGETSANSFKIVDLNPLATYNFRVKYTDFDGVIQAFETPNSISMDVSNDIPSAPLSLTVEEVTKDSVTVSWLKPRDSGKSRILGYKIYQKSSISTNWQEVGQVGRSKVEYTFTDLDVTFDYTFRVCAYSEIGIGKPSETEKIKLKKPLSKYLLFKFENHSTF